MFVELFFPGAVMMTRSLFQLAIDREVDSIRFAKAAISFPIDILFLSFSHFAAAVLIALGSGKEIRIASVMLSSLLAIIVVGFIITLACSKAERAFEDEKKIVAWALAALCYLVSALSILAATTYGGWVNA